MRSQPILLYATWVFALLVLLEGVARAQAPVEAELKAEFLERFTRFIDWPDTEFESPESPFSLCLLGHTPLEPYLAQMARTRRIKGHAIQVRLLGGPSEVGGCELVWIPPEAAGSLDKLLAHTSGKAILTVGDTEGLAARGAHINLKREGTRLTFDINMAQAKRSGLRFSSQLLQLGHLVGGEAPP
ncbi:YfiR family protein [Pyxidicoccus parkwayensis]|uniref:YfiR family protein n=1 Tax=Pyxidicoccus parkwayensis TaxID=2813578 RepID=A0ABX7NZV9_9BACT|nr:YfiR family protein [Pyxidicoccus parkwaysis]QSQ24467.1 YfiR family protein [Pyxidicoccus parkwaysis]